MSRNIVDSITYWGDRAIALALVCELLFFYTLPNLAGCGMTLVCWLLFRKVGLQVVVIRNHPFAWLIYLSMSLYRILPLVATLCEAKPISYQFERPYETFFWETILYLVSTLAFCLAVYRRRVRPHLLQRILLSLGFYRRPTHRFIWLLGVLGFSVSIYLLATGSGTEIGDISGKLLYGFRFFQYAPLVLFFPTLYTPHHKGGVFSWNKGALLYLTLLLLVSLATNSRQNLLVPLGTFALLLLLAMVRSGVDVRTFINVRLVAIGGLTLLLLLPALSDISIAMLATRGMRSDISRKELFEETWRLYNDKSALRQIERAKEQVVGITDYDDGWTEEYVDNFALNRYCNLRITDITLYHANKVGYGNREMRHLFFDRVIALVPMPILSFLGIEVDKVNIYSRGDLLYALSRQAEILVGLRVTSHVADGLATFDYWYFPLQFLFFYLQFLLVDSFAIVTPRGTRYSLLGLITIFSFLAMFRHANGMLGEAQYLVRGFLQPVAIYLLVDTLCKRFKLY